MLLSILVKIFCDFSLNHQNETLRHERVPSSDIWGKNLESFLLAFEMARYQVGLLLICFTYKLLGVIFQVVKRSQKFNKVQTSEPNVCDVDDAEDTISLYGKWQTEPLCLPHAVNGMVPKAGCCYFLLLAFF